MDKLYKKQARGKTLTHSQTTSLNSYMKSRNEIIFKCRTCGHRAKFPYTRKPICRPMHQPTDENTRVDRKKSSDQCNRKVNISNNGKNQRKMDTRKEQPTERLKKSCLDEKRKKRMSPVNNDSEPIHSKVTVASESGCVEKHRTLSKCVDKTNKKNVKNSNAMQVTGRETRKIETMSQAYKTTALKNNKRNLSKSKNNILQNLLSKDAAANRNKSSSDLQLFLSSL